jgi:sugar phosphate isomerase/epimerase
MIRVRAGIVLPSMATPLPIAAQLFTLREYLKTPADIASTLKRVRDLGYTAVQVSGMGKIEPIELQKILRDNGLTCCATHIGLDRMKNETQAVIDEHRLWGCSYTALGAFGAKVYTDTTWSDFAADYTAVANKFAGSGLSIGYHNHDHEFAKFGGKTGLQTLIDNCSKEIWFELDTYWVTAGGGSPAAWIDKVAGRIPCVHLKDYGMRLGEGGGRIMMEVGEGNEDWPAIIAACKRAGVKWYIIEQDTCYRDAFESLKISLENVTKML